MKIIWSSPALADLRRIDSWLTKEARAEIAIETLSAIHHRTTFLESFSRGGRPLKGGHRILRVFRTRYLIRYQITNDVVEIIRIHHEREDWQLEP